MSKEAMTLALEALERADKLFGSDDSDIKAINALKEAIALTDEKPMRPEIKKMYEDYFDKCFAVFAKEHEKAFKELQQEQGERVKKLQVTLEDRPIDIELAQYKRMFEAACSALGEVSDALGCDPEEGGAEPLLAAIAELKTSKQEQGEPVAEYIGNNPEELDLSKRIGLIHRFKFIPLRSKLYTTPQPAQKPLTDEQIRKASLEAGMQEHYMDFHSGFIRFARAIEAAHGIKENT